MWALLSPRLWLAVAVAVFLAGTHLAAYRGGRAHVRAEWDRDIQERTAQALAASEAARARESELQTKVGRADRAYQDQKRATAALAVAASDGLRNLETILAAPASGASSATASGANGTGGLERQLLGNCAAALTELGKQADRLEAKVVGLQAYIAAISKP